MPSRFLTVWAAAAGEDFDAASGQWMRDDRHRAQRQVPVIVYSKGTRDWKSLSRRARTPLASTTTLTWRKRSGSCPATSPCKAIWPPRCWPAARPRVGGGGNQPPARIDARAATDTFSISATACRPTPKWKTSKRWSARCKTSHEQTERRSRIGSKVQRAGAALHLLSARPAVHRPGDVAGGGGENCARRRTSGARPFALFPHPFLRVALLVLRLHHRHHHAARKRRALPPIPGQGNGADERPHQSAAPGGAIALGRRHADLSVARTKFAGSGKAIRKHFNFAPDMEAGVEIDPRRLTRDHVVALREVGFNRASIGVQDFNPKVQDGGASDSAARANRASHRVGARGRVSIRQPGFDLRLALPDGGVLRENAGRNHRAGAGPAGGVQLRARAVDEAGAKDSGAGSRLAQRRNQAEPS